MVKKIKLVSFSIVDNIKGVLDLQVTTTHNIHKHAIFFLLLIYEIYDKPPWNSIKDELLFQ